MVSSAVRNAQAGGLHELVSLPDSMVGLNWGSSAKLLNLKASQNYTLRFAVALLEGVPRPACCRSTSPTSTG